MKQSSVRSRFWITVDGDLPVDDDGNLVYAQGVDADSDGRLEVWVPIMEKAFAKFRDKYGPDDGRKGYADLDNGGSAAQAIYALTGKEATRYELTEWDDQLETILSSANDGGHVTVSTGKKPKDGWVGHHAYTVVGVFMQDGELMVKLRNPWGDTEPDDANHGKYENDGVFAVTLDELRAHCVAVCSDYQPTGRDIINHLFG